MKRLLTSTILALSLWIAALGYSFMIFDLQRAPSPRRDQLVTDNRQMLSKQILGNNLHCMLVNMSGLAFAGIPTAINLVYNGFISGLMMRQISTSAISVTELYYYGRHHAIEFIALWLSGGIGLCGWSLYKPIIFTNDLPDLKLLRSVGKAAVIVILLTIFAAILEKHVSLAAYDKRVPSIPSTDSVIIVRRTSWGAHAMAGLGVIRHDSSISSIVLHHSGFPGTTTPLRIQEYQMNIRDMDDIAYHFYITSDGSIYEGRAIEYAGQHTSAQNDGTDYNDRSIGICLGGNFETNSAGPTAAQLRALHHLLAFVAVRFQIDKHHILFHRDCIQEHPSDSHRISGTVCPGRYALSPLKKLIDSLRTP